MKTIKSLFLAVLALTSLTVSAQTAEEVVAKNIAAMGGMEKLKSLNSVKMEGSLSAQGMDIPITLTKLKDKGLRLDLEVMGTANYQVANGSKGFVFMPVMGHTEPQEMSAAEYSSAKEQMSIGGALTNYKETGSTIEYMGIEEANSAPAYKLKLTKPNGEVAFYYVDQKSNFVSKVSGKREVQGEQQEVETLYRDYKQNEQGYWFPYTQSTISGDINFSKISTNVALDEKIFLP